MKRLFLIGIMASGICASAHAQTEFEHAQARIQEAMSEFFVRPMVAELKMLKEECQEYGPFTIYPGVSMNNITAVHLQEAKASAAYKAARAADADIILGATFYVVDGKSKNKGLDVIVRGYPAKYVNFHSYGDTSLGQDDDKWIAPLQNGAKIRSKSRDLDQTKAMRTDAK